MFTRPQSKGVWRRCSDETEMHLEADAAARILIVLDGSLSGLEKD